METGETRSAHLKARLRYRNCEPVVAACPEAFARIEPDEGIALTFGDTPAGGIDFLIGQLLPMATPRVGSMA